MGVKVTKRFSWVTDIDLDRSLLLKFVRGGRSRWRIENETFNTLKNQGYHFEHNYGHGKENLSTVLMLIMFLAFTVDQVQQACCPLFAAVLEKTQEPSVVVGQSSQSRSAFCVRIVPRPLASDPHRFGWSAGRHRYPTKVATARAQNRFALFKPCSQQRCMNRCAGDEFHVQSQRPSSLKMSDFRPAPVLGRGQIQQRR